MKTTKKMAAQPMLEDWLLALCWGLDILSRPTLQRLLEPYEAWEHRQRFRNQLQYLARKGLMQREQHAENLVYRLTETGRLAALGGRDPEARWGCNWDGKWRMILFDLPTNRQTVRQQLLRWLRLNGFGYLQNSVWIHTDPLTDLGKALDEFRDDVESLTIMDAQCCAGYSNAAIVEGAWDFDEINHRYASYLNGFGKRVLNLAGQRVDFVRASQWLRSERIAWTHAFSLDPLLPRVLWPRGYLGETAWQSRRRIFSGLANQVAAHDRVI
jgi:phenylacetic acid degradation operon negative regulatory protein